MKFIERITEVGAASEKELADRAFEEFKRLSIQDTDGTVPLESVICGYALIASALRWIEKPRIINRVLDDGVRMRDSIG